MSTAFFSSSQQHYCLKLKITQQLYRTTQKVIAEEFSKVRSDRIVHYLLCRILLEVLAAQFMFRPIVHLSEEVVESSREAAAEERRTDL